MTKFFDKKLEDELGTGAAIAVAALSTDLRATMARMDAIRVAQGKPTLQEEAEAAEAYIRQMIADGDATKQDYPWLFEDESLQPPEGEAREPK
ncbi:hypothetical protein KB879_06090 [Cupriavidus sp. KK10]|uniref:hypothetical protein n=1 Tax=Cupriavidus sp. KK10 TaxID=1478019 RepID=UPI001BA54BFE|nr:hypothetical protein [Cupriavidus sp. KK10]QUN29516.1 hypothetical protein KB879_06090 [Cupriavidus sp. KK10]